VADTASATATSDPEPGERSLRPGLFTIEPQRRECGVGGIMLWTVLLVLLALWVLGFALEVGGALIHILLVVAAVVLLFQLFAGRRTVV
jgi:hypothetical protein